MLGSTTQLSARKHRVAGIMLPLAALAIVALPMHVVAQDDSNSIFEEITVTAKKREQSIYEVPVAISAFSGEQIEKQGLNNLTDIGKFVPNLVVTSFGGGSSSSANPFIRGIGLQDHLIFTDPGVAVYVDGIYLGRQIGQNWSLSNIERLEVLRGPQGTLYGRNSIGGAINIITKKPGSTEGGRVGLTVGTEDRLNGEFYADMRLSDTAGLSITGAYESRGGSGKFLLLDNPRVDVGEFKDLSGRIAWQWTPNDRFSVLIAADRSDGEGGLIPFTTLIDELPNGALFGAGFRNSDVSADPYDSNTGQADQLLVSNEASGVSLTADFGLTDELTLKLIASDRHSEYRNGLDDDSVFEDFLSFPESGEADQQSYELQLSGEYDRLNFVFGAYRYNEDGENIQLDTRFLTFPGDFLTRQDASSTALYANLGYQITDRLNLSGGVRFTDDEKNAFGSLNFVVAPPGLSGTGSADFSETSWEIAATFDLSDRMNVYGAIQSGYQSGQFPARPFCLFGDPTCLIASDNITALNYEAGIKGLVTDNFQMSVAVFYTDYSDLPYQISTTTGGGFNTRNVVVDQESTGVEFEGSYALTDNFLLHASVGYIDVDVDDPDAVAPLTPEFTASFSPELTFDSGTGGEITIRADYSFRDDMFGEPTSDPGRLTKIDSRSLINLDIAYTPDDGSYTVAVYGSNLADERYDQARINVGDYLLRILSNDIREYGIRFVREFN